MEKKEPKTPVIHPSLSGGGAPAQRGKSRIAPGAKKGYVVHDKTPPPALKVPPALSKAAPVVNTADDEEMREAIAKVAPEVPVETPVESDPVMAAALAKRAETMNKLLSFTKPVIRSATLAGMEFKFKLLSPAESLHISKILQAMPEEERTIYRTRVLQLAAGLVDIDGVSLESIYQGELERDVVLMRYSEIMKWNTTVLDSALDAYETIIREIRAEFKPDFLNRPKTVTND